MDFASDFVPRLRDDLLRCPVGSEAVIWSPVRHAPVALDAVAAVMLDVVDGEASVAELTNDVYEIVGVPMAVAETRVQRIIGLFEHAGALATSKPMSLPERQRELFTNPPSR